MAAIVCVQQEQELEGATQNMRKKRRKEREAWQAVEALMFD